MAQSAENAKKAEKTYRVPSAVRDSVKSALSSRKITDPRDIYFAKLLSSGSPVPMEVISWVKTHVAQQEEQSSTFGGDAGKSWSSKFKDTTIVAAGFIVEDDLDYYAVGKDESSPENVDSLLAVDDDDVLLTWAGGEWFPLPDTLEDYDMPSIIEISDEDAIALADWVDSPDRTGDFFVLTDIDPEERNLVELAYDEIDWDEIEKLQTLTADATGYSPAERSDNAGRQVRSGDGKFGGPQTPKGTTLTSLAKARLSEPLVLLLDPAARIAEYIASIGEPVVEPVIQKETEDVEEVIVAAGEVESSKTPPLYFAIVDPVDTTAVLDTVSIVPDTEGQVSAWKRSGGAWVTAPELLLDLQGATPPPVVELEDEDMVKDVLSQIDAYDAETIVDAEEEEVILASGWDSPLFGEYGEIIPVVAAGAPGVADTPSDHAAANRLKQYWAFGKGTAKWRPGTPGDLTRLAKNLTKYVGPGRAWGLAQNIFKLRFGMTNAEYDKKMGQ